MLPYIAQLDATYLDPIGSKHGEGNGNEEENKLEIPISKEPVAGSTHSSQPKEIMTGKRGMALRQLVLPEGHKRIVLSLIAQHIQNKHSTQSSNNEETDIVRGKGMIPSLLKSLVELGRGGAVNFVV